MANPTRIRIAVNMSGGKSSFGAPVPLPYHMPYFQFKSLIAEQCLAKKDAKNDFFVVYRRRRSLQSSWTQPIRLEVMGGRVKGAETVDENKSFERSLPDDYGALAKFMCARTVDLDGPAVCYL